MKPKPFHHAESQNHCKVSDVDVRMGYNYKSHKGRFCLYKRHATRRWTGQFPVNTQPNNLHQKEVSPV